MVVVTTRQPLVGVVLAAMAGILLSSVFPAEIWVFEGIGALVLWRFFKGTLWILLATLCAFGSLHRLQTIESRSALLSASLNTTTAAVKATEKFSPIWCGKGMITRIFRGTSSSLLVRTERLYSDEKDYSFPLQILVPWYRKSPPAIGSTISWKGLLRSTLKSSSETAASQTQSALPSRHQAWVVSLGVYLEFYKIRAVTIHPPSTGHPDIWTGWVRRRMEQGITRGIESMQKESILIRALTLGADHETQRILAEYFRRTGTYHIFSVSGLHVGMVGAIAWQAFKIFRIPQFIALPLIILLLFSYSGITGFRPPALRATCMAAVFLCGIFTKRRAFILNSLAAAAIGMLCWDSKQLFYPGFQLSFVVVATIAWLTPPLYQAMHHIFAPDPFLPRRLLTPFQRVTERLGGAIAATLAVSLAAWAGSTPLLLWHFKSISLSALVVNPLVVPLAFVVINLAALSLFCDLFLGTWLASVFAHANLLPTSTILNIVQWAAELPVGFFHWD